MWAALMRWAKKVNERDMSDEARHFADDAPGIMSMPTDLGEWKASLTVAFDAGRRFEQMKSDGAPPCPRCKSVDTEPLRSFGRPIKGRYQCLACRRWFGPNNPADAGGTGEPAEGSDR